MKDRELCFLTLAEQARLIRNREVSPVEVVDSALRQIERVDGQINSFITVTADSARAEAKETEREIARGGYRGPLHGIPIGLKDLLYTRGVRTTAGSSFLRDFVPDEDATVVTRLREAGAVMVGKTNMHEWAFGATNVNPHYGDVHNPWDLDRVSGGSSGGSAAAVAASMVSMALGSDTGGSIRIPAALCGVVGLKPTYGRVSRYGAIPCAWSLDNVGPLCRTAEDAALVVGIIAGWDPRDPASSKEAVPDYHKELTQGIAGLRVAVLQEYVTDPTDPEVATAFEAALELLRQQGARIDTVSVPETRFAVGATTAIMSAEIASYHEERLRSHPEMFGADIRERLEMGLLIAATDYVKAQRVRRMVIERFQDLFRRFDALVCPTQPATAPRFDQATVRFEGLDEPKGSTLVRHTRLFNLTSLPAASVPCGFAANGLPVALQIAAAPFAESVVLRIAHVYQQATQWHLRIPPVATS